MSRSLTMVICKPHYFCALELSLQTLVLSLVIPRMSGPITTTASQKKAKALLFKLPHAQLHTSQHLLLIKAVMVTEPLSPAMFTPDSQQSTLAYSPPSSGHSDSAQHYPSQDAAIAHDPYSMSLEDSQFPGTFSFLEVLTMRSRRQWLTWRSRHQWLTG